MYLAKYSNKNLVFGTEFIQKLIYKVKLINLVLLVKFKEFVFDLSKFFDVIHNFGIVS